MDKNQEKLKPEYSPETISKEFKDLFAQVCDLTRIKVIFNPAKNAKPPISSVEFCQAFFAFLKPKPNNERLTTFKALIENELKVKYDGTFMKWPSKGIPEEGNYAQLSFCISAQVHETDVEKRLAEFLHEWKIFDPEITLPGLKDFKKRYSKAP